MNKKETYEITIAQKLEQLPVLAMEDAIWNRISSQLDIEMPEAPQQAPVQQPGNVTLNIATIFVILTAAIAYFIVKKPSNITHPVVTPAAPVQTSPKVKDSIHLLPPARTPDKSRKEQPADTTLHLSPVMLHPVTVDSVMTDTAGLIIEKPVSTTPVPDTPRKKPAGVKGLKDEDYRIVPKKH